MRVGIMQPYLLPYIGYFQLIHAVDVFVLYDNIQYTKKGWINRNRFLLNGTDAYFTLPLKKASDYLDVREREIADNYRADDIINKLRAAYHKAPYYSQTMDFLREIFEYDNKNLFEFLYNSIRGVNQLLHINTEIILSSSIDVDHSLRSQDKVMAICKEIDAKQYINAIGGVGLYSKQEFEGNDITLKFIKSKENEYKQFNHEFIPWLSIIDLLMFNDIDAIKGMLNDYELI